MVASTKREGEKRVELRWITGDGSSNHKQNFILTPLHLKGVELAVANPKGRKNNSRQGSEITTREGKKGTRLINRVPSDERGHELWSGQNHGE